MKRFSFNLQRALDLRTYRERECEIALGRAVSAQAEIERNIEEVSREEASARARRFSPENGAAGIIAWDRYVSRLENTREALQKEAEEAARKTEEARSEYIEASRDRQVLDKLKEKRRKEHRREYLAEEVKTLDDIRPSPGFSR